MRFVFSLVTISFASLAFAAGCESSSSGGAGPTADGGGDTDGGSDTVVPSTCATPTGAGTTHASVTASET